MAKEIEKKFLVFVNKLPRLKHGITYVQGYLSEDPLIRFRAEGSEVKITIKKLSASGVSRDEWEFENTFSKSEIEDLVGLAIKKPIVKIRYLVKHKDLTWEIDVYKEDNEGLVTADIELPQEDYAINFPSWIDSSEDITNNPKYFNKNLGNNPYTLWGGGKD